MLNVTDHYCISPATSKGGFPVIRVICHESVIYVTGHVSHRSEAQGLLPRITRQSVTFKIKAKSMQNAPYRNFDSCQFPDFAKPKI